MIKTIKIIDLLNMIVNGKYDEIEKVNMYYKNRKIYFDRTYGCNLCSIKYHNNNKSVFDYNTSINLLEQITIKESILDEQEKEYLRAVIRPFRNKIKYIVKNNEIDYEYLSIRYIDLNNTTHCLYFPYFKKCTMYKNMESYKEYTIEELEL